MNRLITIIILLCLPVVSFAEIYSCTGRKDASVIKLNGSWGSISGDDNETMIVDTSRGFRPNSTWDDYIGRCERIGDSGFKCIADIGTYWILWIAELDGAIDFSLANTSYWWINAHGGTCVKI